MYAYRRITWQSENNYAALTLPWQLVKDTFKKYLTGYIKAVKN
jgi:hypothetical protein